MKKDNNECILLKCYFLGEQKQQKVFFNSVINFECWSNIPIG